MDSSGHELRLRAWVRCQQGSRFGGNCFARVDVAQAPKGRLEALHEWLAAFMNRQQQATQKNARSTAASDWQDYSLNQQTVRGSNGWGGTAQSNDPNANPNGVVKGNWTRDKKVHGNGQPR
ncbi:MAG: hypothetical protein HKM03_09900 [Steroidobacteraceae bacterium]|nr:hypothetical protein [Steroidobacteraceae bacterium]